MRLNITMLQNDLSNMHEMEDFTFSEITKESGVHNISRIISGDICPTSFKGFARGKGGTTCAKYVVPMLYQC